MNAVSGDEIVTVLWVAVFAGTPLAFFGYLALLERNNRPRANELATALGATVKVHTSDKVKVYHVIGERGGYPVGIIVNGSDGGKIENQDGAQGPDSVPESQHVCFDDRHHLRETVTRWKQLPEELTRGIIEQMEAKKIERLMVAGGNITIQVNFLAIVRRNGAALALGAVDLANALATALKDVTD